MSTRWYPLYRRGNPQLRVYLPNFWMKIVKPSEYLKVPPNMVHFHCSMEMTKMDIKNYLEKIYGIKPTSIKARIAMGAVKEQENGKMYKEDDVKIAYITLPPNETFKYPDLCTQQKKADDLITEKKAMTAKALVETQKTEFTTPHGMPWFAR